MKMMKVIKRLLGNKYSAGLLLGFLMFAVGFACCYRMYVPAYKQKLAVLEKTVSDYRQRAAMLATVQDESHSEIAYLPKVNGEKTDVEITDAAKKITVKYNGQETLLQPQIEEKQKFEHGKLVIERTQNTVIDITEAFNRAVAAEAKQKSYGRPGKADFGALYNTDTKDVYAGIRYNAKMFDVGAYHGVNNNDVMIGIHGTF